MRVVALTTTLALLVLPVQAAGPSRPTVELQVEAQVTPAKATPGDRAQLRLSLSAPEGIVLNRFPGITFTPKSTRGFSVDQDKVHLGLAKPSKDPAEFYFEGDIALVMDIQVSKRASGSLSLEGDLVYYYCVKKSGFCAPGKQKVQVKVPLG